MSHFYWLVVRRAARSTAEYAREHAIHLMLGLLIVAIAATTLTRLLPLIASGHQEAVAKLLDDFKTNTIADLSVTAGFLVIGGILVFGCNVLRAPATLHDEAQQRIDKADSDARSARLELDEILKSPEHIAQLRQVLGLLPNGRPGQGTLLYDALREHLPDHRIWREQERFRQLVDDAVLGRQAMEARLTVELETAKLPPFANARSLLSQRTTGAQDGRDLPFPDLGWWVKDNMLWLGPEHAIGEARTMDDAVEVASAFRRIWESVPSWSEVVQIVRAQKELPEARETLDRDIADLRLHPQFPGRCHLCMPRRPVDS